MPMVLIAFCVTLHAQPGAANDSVAHLATGGLVLARTADIEMRSEELYVSASRIKVQYRFFNRSQKDITTLVAFPMPVLQPMSEGNDYNLPTDDPVNFLAFQTKVDEIPVVAMVEQRAYAMGLERTNMLSTYAIPMGPHLEQTRKALDGLPLAVAQEFVRLGIVREESYDIGLGSRKHFYPNWSLHTTYYWNQTFPAETEVFVEHEYRPSVGGSANPMIGLEEVGAKVDGGVKQRYCIDDRFVAAVRRARKRLNPSTGYLSEHRLEYILTTGANWAGPIGKFRLVVDKEAPENLVSFCASNVKKISPTRFEVQKTNYWPEQQLDVLLLRPAKMPE